MKKVTHEIRAFLRHELETSEREFVTRGALYRYLAQRVTKRFHLTFNPDTIKTQIRLYQLETKPEAIAKLERDWDARLRASQLAIVIADEQREPAYLRYLDNRMPSRARTPEDQE